MKIYYFLKNITTGEYYLDKGGFGRYREILGKEKDFLIELFKKRVDLRRNSEFFILNQNLDLELIKTMQKFFSGSKVKVKLENKFE